MQRGNSSGNGYTTTPLKSEGRRSQGSGRNPGRSRGPFRGKPKRADERSDSFQGMIIDKMPIYSPPPRNGGFVINPFENPRFLREKLSRPTCSPSLFRPVSSPSMNEEFSWNIDDISAFRPADIDENPRQDLCTWYSPGTEKEAQDAINRFFSSYSAEMESPMMSEVKKSEQGDKPKGKPLTIDSWSQTDFTFPPILPPEVKSVLAKYCIFSNGENKEEKDSPGTMPLTIRKNLFRSFSCETPNAKVPAIRVSTPITSNLMSPGISPVARSSPMDISMSQKTSFNLFNGKEVSDKENLSKSWHNRGSSAPSHGGLWENKFLPM